MEEPDIDELNAQADICLDLKKKRENLNTAWEDACDLMRSKMRDHGRKRYKRHGYPFVIEESEKLVIKKLEDKAPKNPSTRKGKGGVDKHAEVDPNSEAANVVDPQD
jgi:hypothetical protein